MPRAKRSRIVHRGRTAELRCFRCPALCTSQRQYVRHVNFHCPLLRQLLPEAVQAELHENAGVFATAARYFGQK